MEQLTQVQKKKRVKATERLAYGCDEVAAMCGVSESLVRLEVKRGRLRSYRIGERILISADSLLVYLAERQAAGAK